ncbi:hypothetical protein Celal_0828 [Cellulophaga algicola DSM 14237]|uniref:PD-(D/E)XK nuclease superfamily protein n=1 Tax=Cellulophaga algicola (strain DSM 14237 / IC166 / ACAM 630) TaxID=688270 RepID=E6XEV6_CELAD|nr:PD-(D/E)XK nuclease family protein [Cellulophaga algicola]ADV48158.1 hypothetical protein Celal_0828 [Cellulophaga algicola DSM 14237]
MKLPSFFIDDSDSMKYEETIDFFMSWTIRCADSKYLNGSNKTYDRSRLILSKLLHFENAEGLLFSDIKVWKQFENIDLWVELKVNDQDYALIIENKMYSKIHSNQLGRYQKIAEEHYKNDPSRIIIYVLLRPDYELEKQDRPLVILTAFNAVNLEELADCLEEKRTGHDLFDEFWFNWTLDSKEKREKKI